MSLTVAEGQKLGLSDCIPNKHAFGIQSLRKHQLLTTARNLSKAFLGLDSIVTHAILTKLARETC